MDTNNLIGNINVAFEKLFGSIEKDVFSALDGIFVIDEKIIDAEPLSKIIYINDINYMVIIANSFIFFYAVYYIINNFINMYNGGKKVDIFKFILRLVIIGILTNFSIYLCRLLLEINNTLTISVDEIGKKIVNEDLNFTSLKDKIISIEEYLKEDTLSLSGIIKGMLSFGSVSVLINFAVRYVTIIFLIFISPIAIVCLSTELTSGIFFNYIKALLINLFMQNITKLIIIIPLACENTSNIMYKIIMVGSIYMIYKVNSFTKEIFGKFTSDKFGRGDVL